MKRKFKFRRMWRSFSTAMEDGQRSVFYRERPDMRRGAGRWSRSARMRGIHYLTVYAFSTENWKRPQDEVDALMKLLRQYLKDCIKRSMKNNMCVKVLGDLTPLDEDLKESIRELEEVSGQNTGLHFQVALNYGSRDEMIRAMRSMAADIVAGEKAVDDISEEMFQGYLDTKGIPDPDLLIRTSGEERLSNFLLWQLAYTEFYFTDVLWPDFNKKELQKAIAYYSGRDRRFGGV